MSTLAPQATWDQNLHAHSLGIRVHPTVRARTAHPPGLSQGTLVQLGWTARGVAPATPGHPVLWPSSEPSVFKHNCHQVQSPWPEGLALTFCQLWLPGSAQVPVRPVFLRNRASFESHLLCFRPRTRVYPGLRPWGVLRCRLEGTPAHRCSWAGFLQLPCVE